MDYIFYQVAAINGFDALGHYLRAGLIVNTCSQYAIAVRLGLLGEGRLERRRRPRGVAVAARVPAGRTAAARTRCSRSTRCCTA